MDQRINNMSSYNVSLFLFTILFLFSLTVNKKTVLRGRNEQYTNPLTAATGCDAARLKLNGCRARVVSSFSAPFPVLFLPTMLTLLLQHICSTGDPARFLAFQQPSAIRHFLFTGLLPPHRFPLLFQCLVFLDVMDVFWMFFGCFLDGFWIFDLFHTGPCVW